MKTIRLFLSSVVTLSLMVVLQFAVSMPVQAHIGDNLTDVVHACVRTIGDVRIVGPTGDCKFPEQPTHWGLSGQAGPQGAQGPKGDPGPPGTSVHFGQSCLQGVFVTGFDLNGNILCSDGTVGGGGGTAFFTLQNDSFVTGGTAVFLAGFVTGEAGAVVLGPHSTGFTLQKVTLLFGGAATTQTITLMIFADEGTDVPGAQLYAADLTLTGSNAAIQEIDLTAQNIAVAAGQLIRVAVFFQHNGLPSIARDTDGITLSRNYIFAIPGGWNKAENIGVTGDFIIRAVIAPN